MRDLVEGIKKWERSNKQFCIATVIETWHSAPRPRGSSMIISSNREMMGSVSGGCVEKSVVEATKEIFENSKPKLLAYGVVDEDAWRVGLSCGGRIEVFVEKFPSISSEAEKKLWQKLEHKLRSNEAVVWVSEINNEISKHYLVEAAGHNNKNLIHDEAIKLLERGTSQIFEIDDKRYFAHVFSKRKRLLMIGSAHITSELLRLANIYDFETIVIDPRDTFATKTEQVVKPDRLIVKWPQEVLENLYPDKNTFAVILSHDPKIDDAALEILLKKEIPYIGALGSKKTHEKRKTRLLEKGFTEAEIARIHGPVGININAQTAGEIALSIMGEIIKVKNS